MSHPLPQEPNKSLLDDPRFEWINRLWRYLKYNFASYETNGTTASLATSSEETATITHGLGTDDVVVFLNAKGGAEGIADENNWQATVSDADGYNRIIYGAGVSGAASATSVGSASTGEVKIIFENRDANSQTISYRVKVTRR